LKFILQVHFHPLSFSSSWVISPFNLKKINFSTKLYFLYFSILYGWKREGLTGFQRREKKVSLVTITTTKFIYFCVKWFHTMIEVRTMCFFLPWKYLKIYIWAQNDFWFQDHFRFWGICFCVFLGYGFV